MSIAVSLCMIFFIVNCLIGSTNKFESFHSDFLFFRLFVSIAIVVVIWIYVEILSSLLRKETNRKLFITQSLYVSCRNSDSVLAKCR